MPGVHETCVIRRFKVIKWWSDHFTWSNIVDLCLISKKKKTKTVPFNYLIKKCKFKDLNILSHTSVFMVNFFSLLSLRWCIELPYQMPCTWSSSSLLPPLKGSGVPLGEECPTALENQKWMTWVQFGIEKSEVITAVLKCEIWDEENFSLSQRDSSGPEWRLLMTHWRGRWED